MLEDGMVEVGSRYDLPVLTPPIARPDIQIRGPRILPRAVPCFCASVHGPSW